MYEAYWERCWRDENPNELTEYLALYDKMQRREIEIFRSHGAINLCDAACGFGAYTLAFASNGFKMSGFDISDAAVEFVRGALAEYGVDPSSIKVADILDTGYPDACFDGVIAHAVLDHLTAEDSKRALNELLRITLPGGLVMLSFDKAETDDYERAHIVLEDGTLRYTEGLWRGMLFRPYDRDAVEEFLSHAQIIYMAESRREYSVIIKK